MTSVNYGREFCALMALALPGALSTYCFFALSLTMLSVIGHLGVDQLAAVAYSQMSMDFSTLVLMQGFNSGLNALSSQAFGAKNHQLLAHYGQLTLSMLSLLCVPMAVLWWNFGDLLQHVGVTNEVAAYARVYCRLWILGMWPRSMFQALSIFYQAQQIVIPTMIFNIATVGVNLMLSMGLTYGLFGFPALGFIGCPMGTVVAMWLRLIGYFYYMYAYKKFDSTCRWTWEQFLVFDRKSLHALKAMISVGFPIAVGNLFENTQLQTMALFAAKLGDTQLGTHNSMMELFFFATSPIYGLLDASITRMAKHLGAGMPQQARSVAILAGVSVAVISVVNSAIFLSFRQRIGTIFSNDTAVVHNFTEISSLAAAAYVLLAFFCYAMIVLEAQARPLPIMVAFLLGSWGVGVPTAYFLGLCQGRHWFLGIWVGMICGYVVTASVGFYHAHFKTDWRLEAQRAVERSRQTNAKGEDALLLPK